MIRLKKIRENRNWTQKSLAEAMHTTQQTIARWESGKAEPSIANLRDLAVLFGISIDSLIGSEKVIKTSDLMTYGEKKELKDGIEFDGFWGHLGIRICGCEKSKWYPLTESEQEQANYGIQGKGWFYIETLNNKKLFINKKNIERFCLLDDACDRPDDDWDLEWHEYRTYSPEFFTALEKYEADEKDEISESLKKEIQSTIEEEKLDYENIADLTMNITVRLRNGKKETFYPDSFEDYADYVFNLDSDNQDILDTIMLFCDSGDYYFNGDEVAVIEVPISKYQEGQKEFDDEIEGHEKNILKMED